MNVTRQPSKGNKLFNYSSKLVGFTRKIVTFLRENVVVQRITTAFEAEPDAEGFTIPANFPSIELWEADNYTLTGGG